MWVVWPNYTHFQLKALTYYNQKQIWLSTTYWTSSLLNYGVVANAYIDLESSAPSISPCHRRAIPSAQRRLLNRRPQVLLLGSTRMRTANQVCLQPTSNIYGAQNSCHRELSFSHVDIKKRFHLMKTTFPDFFITLRRCYAKLRPPIWDVVIRWWKQRDKHLGL